MGKILGRFKYYTNMTCRVLVVSITMMAGILTYTPFCFGTETGKPVDRIVAIVNEDIITAYELDQNVMPYSERIKSLGYSIDHERKMLFKVREDILNQMIDEKLTDQEVKRTNISVSEKEVDAAIEQIKTKNYFSDEQLRRALTKDGFTMEEYRERTREQILRSKLISYRIKSKIVVTDEEIKAYFENHKKDYGGETKYHLRNIIMPVESLTEEEKAIVYKKMETILELLKEGRPFETLAVKYSQSSLAKDGGNLGLFKLSDLAPYLQEAIKGLKKGEHTPILDTEQGYQIMYVEDIITTPGKTLEEAYPEIQEKLYSDQMEREFKSWLSDLRKQSHIKEIK